MFHKSYDYYIWVKDKCLWEIFVISDIIFQIDDSLTEYLQFEKILRLRNLKFYNISKILFYFMNLIQPSIYF